MISKVAALYRATLRGRNTFRECGGVGFTAPTCPLRKTNGEQGCTLATGSRISRLSNTTIIASLLTRCSASKWGPTSFGSRSRRPLGRARQSRIEPRTPRTLLQRRRPTAVFWSAACCDGPGAPHLHLEERDGNRRSGSPNPNRRSLYIIFRRRWTARGSGTFGGRPTDTADSEDESGDRGSLITPAQHRCNRYASHHDPLPDHRKTRQNGTGDGSHFILIPLPTSRYRCTVRPAGSFIDGSARTRGLTRKAHGTRRPANNKRISILIVAFFA